MTLMAVLTKLYFCFLLLSISFCTHPTVVLFKRELLSSSPAPSRCDTFNSTSCSQDSLKEAEGGSSPSSHCSSAGDVLAVTESVEEIAAQSVPLVLRNDPDLIANNSDCNLTQSQVQVSSQSTWHTNMTQDKASNASETFKLSNSSDSIESEHSTKKFDKGEVSIPVALWILICLVFIAPLFCMLIDINCVLVQLFFWQHASLYLWHTLSILVGVFMTIFAEIQRTKAWKRKLKT